MDPQYVFLAVVLVMVALWAYKAYGPAAAGVTGVTGVTAAAGAASTPAAQATSAHLATLQASAADFNTKLVAFSTKIGTVVANTNRHNLTTFSGTTTPGTTVSVRISPPGVDWTAVAAAVASVSNGLSDLVESASDFVTTTHGWTSMPTGAAASAAHVNSLLTTYAGNFRSGMPTIIECLNSCNDLYAANNPSATTMLTMKGPMLGDTISAANEAVNSIAPQGGRGPLIVAGNDLQSAGAAGG